MSAHGRALPESRTFRGGIERPQRWASSHSGVVLGWSISQLFSSQFLFYFRDKLDLNFTTRNRVDTGFNQAALDEMA